jgi:hydroxymethylpyrimidine/phosphomethylpyrimidine kinase
VQAIHDVPAAFVTAQIDSVFSDLAVGAVKIGMLSQVEVIEAVRAGLDRYHVEAIILDPVMVTTSGHRLIAPEAVAALMARLIRARGSSPRICMKPPCCWTSRLRRTKSRWWSGASLAQPALGPS